MPSSIAPLSAALKIAVCPQLRADRLCCVSMAARSYSARLSSYLRRTSRSQSEGVGGDLVGMQKALQRKTKPA